MSNVLKISRIVVMIILLHFSNALAQETAQPPKGNDDPIAISLKRIEELLVQHSNPRLPVKNRAPLVDARFEPIKFDGCDIKWRLVAPLDKGNRRVLILETGVNLADLDPSDMPVLMDFNSADHWYVHLSTGKLSKLKMQRIMMTDSKVTNRETFSAAQGGFTVDSQEIAEQIANTLVGAVQQCSTKK